MTLPVLTTRGWHRIQVVLVTVSIVIVMLLTNGAIGVASVFIRSDHLVLQGDSDRTVPIRTPGSDRFVYDYAGVLTREQAERHSFDLKRLNEAGIPLVIYIRRSDDFRSESVAYAEQLRTDWDLESADGAEDGIVILVTLSDLSPLRDSLVMSLGPHALPINQLTTDTLRDIYDNEMQPAFRRNEIDLAVSYGVRRILYYEGYTPPDPPGLSEGQATARSLAPWSILLAALYGVFGPLLLTRRKVVSHHLPSFARSWRLYGIELAALLVLSAALSLYGRAAPWLLISVLGGVILLLGVRFSIAWQKMSRRRPDITRVRSRGTRSNGPPILAPGSPRGMRDA